MTLRERVTAVSRSRSAPPLLALALLLLAASAAHPVLWHDPVHSTSEGGDLDTGLFVFFLANTSHALWHAHGHGLLVTHALNAPYGVNVMWNTAMLLPGLLLSPVTELAGPLLTLNLLVWLSPALTGFSAFLCSRRFLSTWPARLIVAFAFAFSPALTQEGNHLHLTLMPLVPPLLLLTIDLASGLRRGWLWAAAWGLVAACQVLVGEEVLVLTAGTALLLLLLLGAQHRAEVLPAVRRLAVALPVATVAGLLVAGYPLLVQFTGPGHVHGELQAHDHYKLDPVQLVVPSRGLLASRGHILSPAYLGTERLGYLGLPLLLVILVVAVLWWRRPLIRTLLVAVVVLLMMALGSTLRFDGQHTGHALPWHLVDRLPVIANVLPIRWVIFSDLLLALLLGLVVEELGRRRAWWAGLLTVAVLLLWLPRPSASQHVVVPELFASGAPGLTGTVLVVPVSVAPRSLSMTWQAVAGLGFRMPGGYAVTPDRLGRAHFGSPSTGPLLPVLSRLTRTGVAPVLDARLRAQLLQELAVDGVTTVVLGPCSHHPEEQALLEELLGAHGEHRLGTLVWTRVPRPT